MKWRNEVEKKVKKSNHPTKIILSDITLLTTATIGINLIWNPINETLLNFLEEQFKNESAVFGILFFLFTGLLMGLFFLFPLKIAYWAGNAMRADNRKLKFKYMLSFLFAILSVLQPCIIFIFKKIFFT